MGVIYSITNKINNACYIGSTITKEGINRWRRHKKDLELNKHHSLYLQRAYNKYGKNNFEFKILEYIDNANILIREQFYLDNRKNNYPSNLNYNMIWIAGSCLGYKHNEIAKKHMSEGHINKHISSETREKMSKTWGEKANKVYTLISPENKIITFNNIRKFSRENNLTQTSIGLLLRGKIFYCNGWVKYFSNSYSFISPCGIVYNNIINLTGFCNEHNLKMKGMSKLHCERAKSYFGWIKNKQI